MNFENLISDLKKILKLKLYFRIPQKKTFLIFDKVGSENLEKFLPSNSYFILRTRVEKINIFVLMKMILRFKFSHQTYLKEYIKSIDPKAIITFIDNNINFYELKFKDIKKISVQNGKRTNLPTDMFYNIKKKNHKKLSCDYIFTQNYPITKFFKKYIKSNYFISGSLKSNETKVNHKNKRFDLVYISTFRNLENHFIYKKYDWIKWQNYEVNLLKLAKKYCEKNGKRLTIIGSELDTKSEFLFYKNLLGNNFYLIKKTQNRNVYKLIDQSKVIFGIDSTLLYEAFGRGLKVGFFSQRGNHFPFNSRKFGWPYKFSSSGNFWSDKINFKTFERVINYLYKVKSSNWKKICMSFGNNIMVYEKNNKSLTKLLKKINLKK